MEAYLQRVGTKDAHSKAITEENWMKLCAEVKRWDDEVDDADLDSFTDKAGLKAEELLQDEKDKRKRVRERMQRSLTAYGVLLNAIPADLRPTVMANVKQGWAYGLWKWLQDKYQSTETSAAHELIEQWINMRMQEGETFEAYKARVNTLHELLVAADEKPSDGQYSHTLVNKLTPRYNQAVLALKAGDKLKLDKAKSIKPNWDEITAFMNAQEREMLRQEGSTSPSESASSPGAAMAAVRLPGRNQQRRGAGRSHSTAQTQCYRCQQYGHKGFECKNEYVPKQQSGQAQGSSTATGNRRSGIQERVAAATAMGAYPALTEEEMEEIDEGQGQFLFMARAFSAVCGLDRVYAAGGGQQAAGGAAAASAAASAASAAAPSGNGQQRQLKRLIRPGDSRARGSTASSGASISQCC